MSDDLKLAIKTIDMLGNAPDGQLESGLALRCRNFDDNDPVEFLRNIRDLAVYYGGASSFTMAMFSVILDKYPEKEEDKKTRRDKLMKAEDIE